MSDQRRMSRRVTSTTFVRANDQLGTRFGAPEFGPLRRPGGVRLRCGDASGNLPKSGYRVGAGHRCLFPRLRALWTTASRPGRGANLQQPVTDPAAPADKERHYWRGKSVVCHALKERTTNQVADEVLQSCSPYVHLVARRAWVPAVYQSAAQLVAAGEEGNWSLARRLTSVSLNRECSLRFADPTVSHASSTTHTFASTYTAGRLPLGGPMVPASRRPWAIRLPEHTELTARVVVAVVGVRREHDAEAEIISLVLAQDLGKHRNHLCAPWGSRSSRPHVPHHRVDRGADCGRQGSPERRSERCDRGRRRPSFWTVSSDRPSSGLCRLCAAEKLILDVG